MNSVVITGNISKDLEIRYSASQTAVLRFTVAVSRRKKEDGADFINCIAFGKTAENTERFCHKGSKVGVKGRIQTGSYEKEDGTRVYTTDIIADEVEFLDSRSDAERPKPKEEVQVDYTVSEEPVPQFEAVDSEIPF